MNKNVKTLSLCALFTALGTVLVYISSFLPSGGISLVAIAGLLTAAAVIHCGVVQGFEVFIATAVLSLFIVPDKGDALFYAAFLGYYPVLKSVLEKKIRNRAYCYITKFVIFNVAFALVLFFAAAILTDSLQIEQTHWALIQLAGNVVFIIYDIGLSRLILFYIYRFSKNIQ